MKPSRWWRRLRVGALGLGGAAAGLLALVPARAQNSATPPPAAAAIAALAHPALAASPAAQWLQQQAEPPREVFDALRRADLRAEDITLLAVPVDDAAAVPLYAYRDDQTVTLASTTKLVTALAALDTLGPDYRWRTRAYLDGPLRDGVLQGNLRLVGGGDARLSAADLAEWFQRMRLRGLQVIRGHIVLDRRVFQFGPADHAHTPLPSAAQPRHNRPDAFWVDEGRVRVEVVGQRNGPPRATLVAPAIDLPVQNRLRPGAGRCADLRERPRLELDDSGTPMRVLLLGQWAADCPPLRLEAATVHPDRFVKQTVEAVWRATGGGLAGTVVDAQDLSASPARLAPRPWQVFESPPLAELIRDMNKSSHNLLARHLMLSLSDRFPNRPATLDRARQRVSGWLRERGLQDEDLHVDNGSGLSYAERGRARALVALLRRAWHSRNAPLFRESLPVAGKDGTLVNRLRDLGPGAEAALKTGTLSQTRALAGYVWSRSGRVYAMAAVVNHPRAGQAEAALDAFVAWVVQHG